MSFVEAIAEKRDGSGEVVRTRPLFPYPQVAKYKGSGSTEEAANFVSTTPVGSENLIGIPRD